MRYIVQARLKHHKEQALKQAIRKRTLGKGSIAGGEYVRNMKQARLLDNGTATWIEICFCDPPLDEERPYWEEYFHLLAIEDAVDRQHCKHETGKKPWSCVSCNCTAKQEKAMESLGKSFYESLPHTDDPKS